jgi:hypothetical protein
MPDHHIPDRPGRAETHLGEEREEITEGEMDRKLISGHRL